MSNLNAIKDLLPDNIDREISEKDLRDSFDFTYQDIDQKLTEQQANLLYLAISDYILNGKIRADKIESLDLKLDKPTMTANYIGKWNGTNFVNGLIYDNGSSVGIGTAAPTPATVFDVQATGKVSLPAPRMTQVQRLAIALSSLAAGGLVYQTDGLVGYYLWDGATWKALGINISNADLTNTTARTFTQNAAFTWETLGNPYYIKGLPDKSADASFKKIKVQNLSGQEAVTDRLYSFKVADTVSTLAFQAVGLDGSVRTEFRDGLIGINMAYSSGYSMNIKNRSINTHTAGFFNELGQASLIVYNNNTVGINGGNDFQSVFCVKGTNQLAGLVNFTNSANVKVFSVRDSGGTNIGPIDTLPYDPKKGDIIFKNPENDHYLYDGAKWNAILFSWMYRRSGILATAITIGTTAVDLTPLLATLTETKDGSTLVYYDSAAAVFKVNANSNKYQRFQIVLRLSGTVSGGTGSTSEFEFQIRRPDNTTIVAKSSYFKIAGSSTTLDNVIVCDIPTRVFSGGNDLYQTQGFKIFAVKVQGNNLTIDNTSTQNLFIEK